MFITALDAKSGEALWSTNAVGDHAVAVAGRFAATQGTVLFFSDSEGVVAFDGKTGKQRWSKPPLTERVRTVCEGESGSVRVALMDQTDRTVALSDGSLSKATNAACSHASTDAWAFPAGLQVIEPRSYVTDNVRADFVVRIDGGWLIAGHKAKGSNVPMFAATGETSADTFELRNPIPTRWEAPIPSHTPLGARNDDDHFAVSHDTAFAAYTYTEGLPRLTAISLSDGIRRWDVEIDRDAPLSGVAYAEGRVFVALWSSLIVYAATTGEEVERVGL